MGRDALKNQQPILCRSKVDNRKSMSGTQGRANTKFPSAQPYPGLLVLGGRRVVDNVVKEVLKNRQA